MNDRRAKVGSMGYLAMVRAQLGTLHERRVPMVGQKTTSQLPIIAAAMPRVLAGCGWLLGETCGTCGTGETGGHARAQRWAWEVPPVLFARPKKEQV